MDINDVIDDAQEVKIVEERWCTPGHATKDKSHRNAQQNVVVGSECQQVAVNEYLQVRLKEVVDDKSAVGWSESKSKDELKNNNGTD